MTRLSEAVIKTGNNLDTIKLTTAKCFMLSVFANIYHKRQSLPEVPDSRRTDQTDHTRKTAQA